MKLYIYVNMNQAESQYKYATFFLVMKLMLKQILLIFKQLSIFSHFPKAIKLRNTT